MALNTYSTYNNATQLLVNHDANSTATSSCSSTSFMECADLGNITYPFWGSASCAASPMYVLSDCTNSSAPVYWDMFPASVHSGVPPEVTSFSIQDQSIGEPVLSIQLSWNKSLNVLDFCAPPFSSGNLSQYNIPTSINLTGLPDLAFSFSNTFLLFNCSNNASENMVDQLDYSLYESAGYSCTNYKESCSPGAMNTPCIEWKIDTISELMLQDVLDSMSCSHFTFGIASVNGNRIFGKSFNDWKSGSIELIWEDAHCVKCENALGSCIFDANFTTKFNRCECYGSAFDYNKQTCDTPGCRGGLLNCKYRGAKIGVEVALGILVLGFGLAVVAWYYGSMIRKGLTFGFLTFIKAIIPIAISVLKKTLKKLQTSSYGPTHTLHALDVEGLTERPMEYSYSSIASATKSFSSLVGEGGFGRVYKGTLPQATAAASSHGGLHIAVKVLEVGPKHIKKQFLNEVITIGRIHHVNVVRLLGFCMQEDHEMLVYEYVENGSLDGWLFDDKQGANQKQVLNWGQRYAIALGIARGLSYLHEECRHRTVHCDIKPQNILLDGEMHPKIADFGLARLMSRDESKVVTSAKGTPGYMAPEFWMGGESQLTTKYDVYSYGMVLLELISGQRNFRRNVMITGSNSFPAMAFKAAMQGDLESILDARLGITKNNCTSSYTDADLHEAAVNLQWKQIKTAVFVALWCIQDQPASRPWMSEVVKYLEGGAAVSECPPQPTISTSSTPVIIPQEFVSSMQLDDFTPISTGR